MISRSVLGIGCALALAAVLPAHAATDLIKNGGFETTTSGPGQLGYNTDATGWSVASGGYTFLFASGTADTTGSSGQFGNLQLWGPGNGSANGMPASSPDGGNYVAEDGAFQVEPLTQTIDDLAPGAYEVTFYWGGAQQYTFTGATTEQFQVSLGSQTKSTRVLDDSSHGFTGWKKQSFVFTTTGGDQVLSFLAVGTPNGVPPFSVLDGVSMIAVPEPATWVMLIGGIAAVGGVARARRRTAMAAAVA